MCEVINYCIAEGENVKDKIPDVFKVSEPDKIKEIEIEDVLLIDYDKKKIFVCWVYDVDDRHIEAIHTIWTDGWEAKRQTSGIAFNFEYTQKPETYTKLTEQQFSDYLEEYKLLELK